MAAAKVARVSTSLLSAGSLGTAGIQVLPESSSPSCRYAHAMQSRLSLGAHKRVAAPCPRQIFAPHQSAL